MIYYNMLVMLIYVNRLIIMIW